MSGMELSVGVRPYSGGGLVGRWPVAGFSCQVPGDSGRRADPGAKSEGRWAKCGLRLNSRFYVFKWLKEEDYFARRGNAMKPKCQPPSIPATPGGLRAVCGCPCAAVAH